jgi:predicted CoA-binding protein
MSKKTLILGTSTNPDRYSFKAAQKLVSFGHEIYCFGKQKGFINETEIKNTLPTSKDFDTVTLYLNPSHQKAFYDSIIELRPNRVIFNPGTENLEFQKLLSANSIYFEESCTLVLLSLGEY